MPPFGRLCYITVVTILLSWSLMHLIFSACFADQIRIIRFKEQIPNKALEGHTIKSKEVLNEGSCRVLCYMEPKCVSINVGPLKGGTHRCELNEATAEQQDSTHALTNMPGYTHLSIENPCKSSPCLNHGTCLAGFTEKGFLCNCLDGFTGEMCSEALALNCVELYKAGEKTDGVYTIKPDNGGSFKVFCDQTTAGGGWTVFQKRLDGSVDFYRGWEEYKKGFGKLSGEFWLGLEKIRRLIKQRRTKLRVDLEDFNGTKAFAQYDYFGVASEEEKYKLSFALASYSGTAGDSLIYHHDFYFSTKDQDNDKHTKKHCAQRFKGAWWYKACHKSNLNGRYLKGYHSSFADGVNWRSWRGYYYSVKRAEMKIRSINDEN